MLVPATRKQSDAVHQALPDQLYQPEPRSKIDAMVASTRALVKSSTSLSASVECLVTPNLFTEYLAN